MNFTWTRLPDIQIPNGDGMGAVYLNGKVYSIGRWSADGVTHNDVWFTTDCQTWTASAVPRPWIGRHSTPTLAFNGRIFLIGGDYISGSYLPEIWSWDGLEPPLSTGWIQEESNLPALNRVGHFAFATATQICFGGGQTMTPMTPAPTKFFTDLWCSPTGFSGTWTEVSDDIPIGIHGFISSGSLPVIDGRAYAWAGGTYTTSDYPDRSYINSVVSIDDNLNVHLENSKNQMPPMFYNSVVALNGVLFNIVGHNGNNLASVWASFDQGKTVTQLANYPGTATHAASVVAVGNELLMWGGLEDGGQHAYHLNDDSKLHYGALPDSTTNLGSLYTICDRTVALTPGETVTWFGFDTARSHPVRPKIARENSPTNFDIVYNGAQTTHPGGGYADFSAQGFIVPSDGATYRLCVATQFTPGVPDAWASLGSRAMVAGDANGNGVGMIPWADGSLPFRWTKF